MTRTVQLPVTKTATRASRVAVFSFALLVSAPSFSVLSDDEARRAILDLRARTEQLTVRLEGLEKQLQASGRNQLETLNENERLRSEIAKLRGTIDELQRQSSGGESRQKDLYGDLDRRLKAVEPVGITVNGRSLRVNPAEKEKFEEGQASLKSGNFKKAFTDFETFESLFPSSALLADALLGRGSAAYALQDYKQAILARQSFIARFPVHPEKPQVMLNLSSALAESGDITAARSVLEALAEDHSDSSASQEAKERLKELPKESGSPKPKKSPQAAGGSSSAKSGSTATPNKAKAPQKTMTEK